MIPPGAVDRLHRVSALRELCARLPHVPTPAELGLLRRFEALEQAPETATGDDVAALTAGWRAWWRKQETARLKEMVARVPPAVIESDRWLVTYAAAAELS